MKNPRISPKERGLLKGAIRRVFSRSELRKSAVERGRIEHTEPQRPRVKKWSRCEMCLMPTASYEIQVDHKLPLVPVDSSLEEMSWDDLVNRCWCSIDNLQGICEECHKSKSKEEAALRKINKKLKKGK